MDTVWYVRQCEGIICTLMYIYSRWNIDWWPDGDDRCAGSMLERMSKIIYSSPYASHETATSHVVKYWYRITCPWIWKHNVTLMYIYSRWNVAELAIEFSVKVALFWLFCLLSTHTACPQIQTISGYARETPRDWSWLGTGHKNKILNMDDSCSF